jgi:hypothetical protein
MLFLADHVAVRETAGPNVILMPTSLRSSGAAMKILVILKCEMNPSSVECRHLGNVSNIRAATPIMYLSCHSGGICRKIVATSRWRAKASDGLAGARMKKLQSSMSPVHFPP